MAEYTLHCFAQSGNAYKVALMLELNGADWEPVWIDFFSGGTRTPEYLALNQMGEVPVLEHGEVVVQPVRRHPRLPGAALPRFAPRSEEERREVLRWTLWDNHKLTGSIAAAALPDEVRPRGKDRPATSSPGSPGAPRPRSRCSTAASS